MTVEEKIAALTDASTKTAEAVSLLLARDPAKEFTVGKFYPDGFAPSRIMKVEAFSLIPAAASTPLIFASSLDVQEILVEYRYNIATSNTAVNLRLAFDTDKNFRNVPPDFSRQTLMLEPDTITMNIVTPATGTCANYWATWSKRLKLPYRYLSLAIQANKTDLTSLNNFTVTPLTVAFCGK